MPLEQNLEADGLRLSGLRGHSPSLKLDISNATMESKRCKDHNVLGVDSDKLERHVTVEPHEAVRFHQKLSHRRGSERKSE